MAYVHLKFKDSSNYKYLIKTSGKAINCWLRGSQLQNLGTVMDNSNSFRSEFDQILTQKVQWCTALLCSNSVQIKVKKVVFMELMQCCKE